MIWMLNMTTEDRSESENQRLDSLLCGIAEGNREALAQLYGCTRAAVYGLALSYMKDPGDAEDVTQDTFVQVWNCAQSFRPQGHPMAWLMTITRNMALQKLRGQSRQQFLEPEEWQQMLAPEQNEVNEDRMLLRQVLARLSPEESRIVTLHAVAGLRHREIARIEEMPLSTELSRYHRALKKLKTMMEGDDTK